LRCIVRWKEPQRIDSVDPHINRTARGGVDPIPLRLPPIAVASPSIAFSLPRRSDLVTALLLRSPIQPPAPPRLVLALPLHTVLLLCMIVNTLCHIRSNTNPSGEMATEGASIPDPRAVWVRSTMKDRLGDQRGGVGVNGSR
jgi:hypothetical protein